MIDLKNIKIRRSARSSIAIKIDSRGNVIVNSPFFIPKLVIINFVKSKSLWIEKRLKIVKKNYQTKKKFENGELFKYLGRDYQLALDATYVNIEIKGGKLFFPLALAKRGNEMLQKWYIKQAKLQIEELASEYSKKMGVSYKSITFSDTKSQWGRCTHDNRLQFNWRLIMAPLLVVRYVVIHELSHIIEKNHSDRFWSIVRSYNPSYKSQIKWLKENGLSLRH